MGMLRLAPLVAVIPISLLLTASFFVLFALRKVEEKWLKAFGYLVASLLGLAAVVVLYSASLGASKDPSRMKYMMQQRMKDSYRSQMMPPNMPDKVMAEKGVAVKN